MDGHARQEDPERVAGDVHDHDADEDDGQVVLRAASATARLDGLELLLLLLLLLVVVVGRIAVVHSIAVCIVVVVVVILNNDRGRATLMAEGNRATNTYNKKQEKKKVDCLYNS